MKKFILTEKNLFTAQMKNALKGFKMTSEPRFIQDAERTVREIKFTGDNKIYCLLSWNEQTGKPAGVLPRYSEDGKNEKSNKIMVEAEVKKYILENGERAIDV